MTHLWVRAEHRANEDRVGLTPDGAARLIAAGFRVTVEDSPTRIIPTEEYRTAGAEIAPPFAWTQAPEDAIIFGLKELPDDGTPLPHRHIMFGHAFKGQPDGRRLLARFKAGGGTLYDLEYLSDDQNRRVAAFGYWAGYAGAAVSLMAWTAQQRGEICPPIGAFDSDKALLAHLQDDMARTLASRPTALIVGAKGRVGSGATDLCTAMGVPVTAWDIAETAHGGPFPEIPAHQVFLNCILANPGCPVFVPSGTTTATRRLSVIGDIACDPTSDFSPIKVYDRTTTWGAPTLRVHDAPPLDVVAIDNLPSMLPLEASQDYATQLLPVLSTLDKLSTGVWARAKDTFDTAVSGGADQRNSL